MDVLLILLLTVLNGAFALSEMALAASRKVRLMADAEAPNDGRLAALRLLAPGWKPEWTPVVTDLLEQPGEDLRATAADVLAARARRNDPVCAGVLLKTLGDGDARVRMAVAAIQQQELFPEMSALQRSNVGTIISELGTNILKYASTGRILLRAIRCGHRRGVEVLAIDEGPGIPDIAQAMQDEG